MRIDPSIKKSAHFGRLEFPERPDYVNYFLDKKLIRNENDLWENEELVSLVHRHWHSEGRNGCIFALLAARRAEELGWQQCIITKDFDTFSSDNSASLIHKKISQAIANPKCQVLSLLFSKITSDTELVSLISFLLKIEGLLLVNEEVRGDWVTLQLRVPINNSVLSWLMAFGPYNYFPQTRQSPITEIAIRVKEKPEIQFHRLSKDLDAAHLADLPLDYNDQIMEQTWLNTEKRTRLILNGEPDDFSAAKTTFTVPKKIWEQR